MPRRGDGRQPLSPEEICNTCAYRNHRQQAGFGGKSGGRLWGVSLAEAASLIGFLMDGKWEYGRRFVLWVPKTSSVGCIDVKRVVKRPALLNASRLF